MLVQALTKVTNTKTPNPAVSLTPKRPGRARDQSQSGDNELRIRPMDPESRDDGDRDHRGKTEFAEKERGGRFIRAKAASAALSRPPRDARIERERERERDKDTICAPSMLPGILLAVFF